MLAGLFMKNIPVAPATPFFESSPFPLAETDELDARTPSPRTFTLPRRQTVIDPSLVSADTVCVRVTLKDWHSPCTSVSFRYQMRISSFYNLISENPPPCNEYYLMQSCSKEVRKCVWNTRGSRSKAAI